MEDEYIEKPKYSLEGKQLSGFEVMGYTQNCMKAEKFDQSEIDEYFNEVKSMTELFDIIMFSSHFIEMCNCCYFDRLDRGEADDE